MPSPTGSSGGLSGADFHTPFANETTISSLDSIPAGTYGDGAKILLILTGRSGQTTTSPKQSFTIGMSGGPITVTAASPYAVNGSKPTTFTSDPNNYVVFAWIIEPDGWSFDSGSTFTIAAQQVTAYVLTGTVSCTGGPSAIAMTGSGTKFTTELTILSGSRSVWLPGFVSGSNPLLGLYASVQSVTDDTHCTIGVVVDAPAISGAQLTATIFPQLDFAWRMLTFTSAPPAGTGVTTATLYGSTTGTTPLFADGTTTWTTTTSTGEFGLLTDSTGALFNTYLANASLIEGYAVMQCLSTTGPDSVNLTGAGSWATLNNQGDIMNGSSGHVTQGIARWTRPATLNTLYAWSNFPASTFGHGFFLLFTSSAVGVGHSFAVIMV